MLLQVPESSWRVSTVPCSTQLSVRIGIGYYPMLIAAAEAFRTVGYERTKRCLIELWTAYKTARAASQKDDLVDDNGDNIPDVLQISKSEVSAGLELAMGRTTGWDRTHPHRGSAATGADRGTCAPGVHVLRRLCQRCPVPPSSHIMFHITASLNSSRAAVVVPPP